MDLLERESALRQLSGALDDAARERGRVVLITVIEDVHWADEATLDLLRFLGRRSCGR